MRKHRGMILTWGLIIAILISNAGKLISDGLSLDQLRSNVLRLHILANSDSEYDQDMKLKVRDAILESGILRGASDMEEAERITRKKLDDIETLAELTLEEYGCDMPVRASLAYIDFDEREYGDMTMPAGNYRALRIEIGKAEGHNWWCVMYPPLCLPAASEVEGDKETEEAFFSEKEKDILEKPQKYRVRFAIWDKLTEIRKGKQPEPEKNTYDTKKKCDISAEIIGRSEQYYCAW